MKFGKFIILYILTILNLSYSLPVSPAGLGTDGNDKDLSEDPLITHVVTFEIKQGENILGLIEIGLFGTIVPKTVKNFYSLLSEYTDTIFHRVIKDFVIQGGDYDGKGGHSIYGTERGSLLDENFELKHDKPGRLSMANSGPNSAGSQFFICAKELPHLDNNYVVFGQVLNGMEVVTKIENVETDAHDKPIVDVVIVNAKGVIVESEDLENDIAPNAPADAPAEASLDKPDDTPAETPAETPVDAPAETPVDTPTETPVDTPENDKAPSETSPSETSPSETAPSSTSHISYLLPVVLLSIIAGFIFFKYRSKIMFAIKGPRYRRLNN